MRNPDLQGLMSKIETAFERLVTKNVIAVESQNSLEKLRLIMSQGEG